MLPRDIFGHEHKITVAAKTEPKDVRERIADIVQPSSRLWLNFEADCTPENVSALCSEIEQAIKDVSTDLKLLR